MRGGDEVVEAHELVLAVGRLVDEGIAGGGADDAVLEGVVERVFVHDAAAGGVDEDGALLHVGELFGADHVLGLGREGHGDVHHVGHLEHVLELVVLLDAPGLGLLARDVGVVAHELRVEAAGEDRAGAAGDVAHAHEADGLAGELCALHLGGRDAREALAAGHDVAVRDVAGRVEHEAHDELGHGVHVGRGGVDHGDAVLLGGLEVDGVAAHAVLADDLEVRRLLDDLAGDLVGADDDTVDLLGMVEALDDLDLLGELGPRRRIDVLTQIDLHAAPSSSAPKIGALQLPCR